MENIVGVVAEELELKEANVAGAVQLLFEQSCTIPFVARYRKEMTGSMDEVNLRQVRDRYQYIMELEQTKKRYLKVVAEHCKTKPSLKGAYEPRKKFLAASTKQELEDLYLPFKPKRRTRAFLARQRGLEPLCDQILAELGSITDLEAVAAPFVRQESPEVAPEQAVGSAEEALKGAADIFAERVNEMRDVRKLIRELSFNTGRLEAKKSELLADKTVEPKTKVDPKKKDPIAKYENYFSYSEPLLEAAPHRIMAVRRGEAEKVLRLSVSVDSEAMVKEMVAYFSEQFVPNESTQAWFLAALQYAY